MYFHRTLMSAVLLLLQALCVWPLAWAQPSTNLASTATATPAKFATVFRIRGTVSVVDTAGGAARGLREGDVIRVGERVTADATGEAVLRTEDAGFLALRPGGVFVAESFSALGNASDNLTLRVVVGALRIVSGWVSHTNRSGVRVLTPSATIGIRGTDHEPFVLSSDLSMQTGQPEGTYNKVNRGGTTLETRAGRLDLEPGKVGFVRTSRTRGLLTLLTPVLLDRVPEFFMPGQFDSELDGLSAQADQDALRELERLRSTLPAGPSLPAPEGRLRPGVAPAPAAAKDALPATRPSAGLARAPLNCAPQSIAREWLGRFDDAVVRRDASAVEALFASELVVQVKVLVKDGATSEFEVGRDDMVKSATTALEGLTDYSQRRPSIEGRTDGAAGCDRVAVTSLVIEQGRQNGKPYRFEAIETYVLERRAGRWVAVRASTTQR
ncbi:MAG: hypothetical protein LH632_18215 [Rhodoferax sp.]|nr:hypothetical protein [Rhodoferax sp.]